MAIYGLLGPSFRMPDQGTFTRTVPHYIAMLLIVFLVLAGLRRVAPNLHFLVEFTVVIVASLTYVSLVRWLGVAPRTWSRNS